MLGAYRKVDHKSEITHQDCVDNSFFLKCYYFCLPHQSCDCSTCWLKSFLNVQKNNRGVLFQIYNQQLMLKWLINYHCACNSEIGTCITNDAGRQAAHKNNENTRFWSNLAKRRFILMFWRYILTFNAFFLKGYYFCLPHQSCDCSTCWLKSFLNVQKNNLGVLFQMYDQLSCTPPTLTVHAEMAKKLPLRM
jgi:hypothetical protein